MTKIKSKRELAIFVVIIMLTIISVCIAISENMFYNIIIIPIIGLCFSMLFRRRVYIALILFFVIAYISHLVLIYMETEVNSIDTFLSLLLSSIPWAIIYTILCGLGVVIMELLNYTLAKGEGRKLKMILALMLNIFIVVGIVSFANQFLGNPISKILAINATNKYIEENFKTDDLVVKEVNYNFKDGGYNAHIVSPSSVDTYFSVSLSMLGKVRSSTYENVLRGWNTYTRINKEYRKLVDNIFSADDFPFVSNIDFGEIKMKEENNSSQLGNENFGIDIGSLEVNKDYNVRELAKKYGHIVYYAQDGEVTYEKAGEILLNIKKLLDSNNIPFYTIDFVLEKPRGNNKDVKDSNSINTQNFLYSDIYEQGIVQRLEENHKILKEYYSKMDLKGK